VFPYAEIN